MAAGVSEREARDEAKGGPHARWTTLFGILCTLLFVVVGLRLFQLQVLEHEIFVREAAGQIYSPASIPPVRGLITDTKGAVLASSVAVRACAIDPKLLLDAEDSRPERLVETLTEILALTPAETQRISRGIERRRTVERNGEPVEEPYRFIWVKRKISEEQWRHLTAEMTAAQKQAAAAAGYRRQWLKKAGERKVARDSEGERKAREAAEGWRRIAARAQGRFAGVFFPPEYERVYPQGSLAAHILGFGNIDGEGLEGVEKTCEALLQGTPIRRLVARDARSRALSTLAADTRTTEGMTVELTIDSVIQSIVEEELQLTVDKLKTEFPEINAHALVMDPWTGDILAIANYPTFDPNRPGEFPARNRRNDVVAAVQEPGSTFKPLMIAASLEEKVASLEDQVECAAFRMENGRTIKDIFPYGRMTLEMALVKSSNPAMVRTGLKLGPEKMREYVLKYGFGDRTGSLLPGEVRGRVTAADRWSSYTMGSVPMGYEINVTSLQMAAAYCVFANGGELPRPNIVRAVYDTRGGLVLSRKPEMRRRVISAETAETMRKVLRKVVTDGTGRRANIKEYHIGGKTGTAEMIVNDRERAAGLRGYSKKRHTANFVALAPWDKPKAVIVVSIRETGKYGGEAPSPVVAGIARRLLGYWGVPTLNGEAIRPELFSPAYFDPPPVPAAFVVGDADDENVLSEEVDSRIWEEWIEDDEALG